MAVCNLFRALNKETGNFLMFSQYAEDLNRCYVQHDSYDVIPARFVALDINYSGFNPEFDVTDHNTDIPLYFQNYFENGCAWMRGNSIGEDWTPEKWTPEISSNLFWNAMTYAGLISVDENEDFSFIKEVKYVGDIDIHSYNEKDGVGYSEIYCFIPNAATETQYQVIEVDHSETPDPYYEDTKSFIEGYDEDALSIKGILNPQLNGSVPYYYAHNYASVFTQDFEQEIEYRSKEVGSNSFTFNTIVVLYDVYVRDADANITTVYKNVPMGIFFTGKVDADEKMGNEVLKYSNCNDAYGSGTSYGLRVATRYTVTPNATTIANTEVDTTTNYAAFSQAMAAMAQSQAQMNDIIEELVNRTQDIKDHLAMFKNYRVNVPYALAIGEGDDATDYWFVNGRNTGVRCSGKDGKSGEDGLTPTIGQNGNWFIGNEDTGIVAEGSNGAPGEDGVWWFFGKTVPSGSNYSHAGIPCKTGDCYMNVFTGKIYILEFTPNAKWTELGTLKGTDGANGTNGTNIITFNDNKKWMVDYKDTLKMTVKRPLPFVGEYKRGDVLMVVNPIKNYNQLGDDVAKNTIYTVSDVYEGIDGTTGEPSMFISAEYKGSYGSNPIQRKPGVVYAMNIYEIDQLGILADNDYMTLNKISSDRSKDNTWVIPEDIQVGDYIIPLNTNLDPTAMIAKGHRMYLVTGTPDPNMDMVTVTII